MQSMIIVIIIVQSTMALGAVLQFRGCVSVSMRLVALLCLLASCQARGQAEFELYRQAYEAQYVEADAVLVELAKAERTVWFAARGESRVPPRFNPDDAAYFVKTVEPPVTASLRASIRVLKDYNDALTALANGENAKAISARISKLTSEIASAVATVGSVHAAPSQSAAVKVATSKLLDVLTQSTPLLDAGLQALGREAFRRQLLDSGQMMKDLIAALRTETPGMFDLLKESHRAYPESGVKRSSAREAVEKARVQLAVWVLLLDKSYLSLEAALDAANAPMSAGQGVDALTNAAIEMRVLAEKVKSARAQ